MSTTYFAMIINILAVILPKIGVQVGTDQLTTTLATLFAVGSAVWALIERVKRGDVTWFGKRI